ncbi:MAG: sialate O-acetylesterase, partial [Salinimicrobium sp.]
EKGSLKGILWHQGESDAFLEKIPGYEDKLKTLFQFFRSYPEKENLPIVCGELGSFSTGRERNILWEMINSKIEEVEHLDPNLILVRTEDLKAKSDNVHFNAQSQRTLGIRYAKAYLQLIDSNSKI